MSATLLERHCHAGPGCHRRPRFQAQLHRTYQTPSQSPAARILDTCADHLGDTVQALARWASTTGFGSGLVEFSVVGGAESGESSELSAFLFAAIHIPA